MGWEECCSNNPKRFSVAVHFNAPSHDEVTLQEKPQHVKT